MSEAMAAVPSDSPLMKAWEKYKAGEDFKNSYYWATSETVMRPERAEELKIDLRDNIATKQQRHERIEGSLWAAFVQGFNAAGGQTTV